MSENTPDWRDRSNDIVKTAQTTGKKWLLLVIVVMVVGFGFVAVQDVLG